MDSIFNFTILPCIFVLENHNENTVMQNLCGEGVYPLLVFREKGNLLFDEAEKFVKSQDSEFKLKSVIVPIKYNNLNE